jgi:hypothetical protein
VAHRPRQTLTLAVRSIMSQGSLGRLAASGGVHNRLPQVEVDARGMLGIARGGAEAARVGGEHRRGRRRGGGEGPTGRPARQQRRGAGGALDEALGEPGQEDREGEDRDLDAAL